jgi:molybdopterin molybdotransferase
MRCGRRWSWRGFRSWSGFTCATCGRRSSTGCGTSWRSTTWWCFPAGSRRGSSTYLPAELDRQGVKKVFQGVAQRPGKPFWFGRSLRGTPVFALPGNPVSAYTCLHRYVLPALWRASGMTPPASRRVALAERVAFRPKLAWLLPVRLASGPGAELLARPDPSNTSGDFAGLVGTDGFVELPPGPAEFPAGTGVPFYPW